MGLLIANKALYMHTHKMADGSIIVHAHPYNKSDDPKPFKSHQHTKAEFLFLENLESLFLLTFLIFSLIGNYFQENEENRTFILNSSNITILCFFILFILYLYFIYLKNFKRTSSHEKKVFQKIYLLMIGISLMLLGNILTWRFFSIGISIFYRIIGDIISIVGVNLFFIISKNMTDYREFFWNDYLDSIFVVNDSGLLLFNRDYKENVNESRQEYLIGGGIYSIQTIISMITSEEELNIIELEDKSLIFEKSHEIIVCAIAKKHSKVLQYRLKQFLERFYLEFEEHLKHWNGNMDIFKKADEICDDLFPRN